MEYKKLRKKIIKVLIETFKEVELDEKFIKMLENGASWDHTINLIISDYPKEIKKIEKLLSMLAEHKDAEVRKIATKIKLPKRH